MQRFLNFLCILVGTSILYGCTTNGYFLINGTNSDIELTVLFVDCRDSFGRLPRGASLSLERPFSEIQKIEYAIGTNSCAVTGTTIAEGADTNEHGGNQYILRGC